MTAIATADNHKSFLERSFNIVTLVTAFISVFTAMILILPNCGVTSWISNLWLGFCDRHGFTDVAGNFNSFNSIYWLGYFSTLLLLVLYCLHRKNNYLLLPKRKVFINSAFVFTILYLLDYFLSSSSQYRYEMNYWPFIVFGNFWLIIIFGNTDTCKWVIPSLIAIVTLQSCFAITYYVAGVNQFRSPIIGDRTSGTFQSPLDLYPLCLMILPLCMSFQRYTKKTLHRWLLHQVTLINSIALILTFTRAAWIAEGVVAIYFLWRTQNNHDFQSRVLRRTIIVISIFLLVGAPFMRSKGTVVGVTHDRSILGRVEIWRVAERAFWKSPIYGTGLATFEEDQNSNMTHRLLLYNPTNVEAKCVLLNFSVEFGIIGVILLFALLWKWLDMCRALHKIDTLSSQNLNLILAIQCAILAVLVAGCVDTPILEYSRMASTFLFFVLIAISCIVTDTTKTAI